MIKDRRTFLKTGLGVVLGAAAGDLSRPVLSSAASPSHDFVMIIDLNKCNGCESCVMACKGRNGTSPYHFLTRIDISETGHYPDIGLQFMPVQCNQCEDAPCVLACPIDATYKLANGIVFTDWNICTAIGDCVTACPYGARHLDPRFGNRVDKCDFCLDRLERGLEPSCVESCPPGARIFGDRNHPSGAFADYIKRSDLLRPKPELGIKTNLFYVPIRKGQAI